MAAPLAPIVVNGMVFAAASGEFRGAGTDCSPPTRAALDAGRALRARRGDRQDDVVERPTITSFARSGLAAGAGQVYLVTYDNTLYAFGIPMEH